MALPGGHTDDGGYQHAERTRTETDPHGELHRLPRVLREEGITR